MPLKVMPGNRSSVTSISTVVMPSADLRTPAWSAGMAVALLYWSRQSMIQGPSGSGGKQRTTQVRRPSAVNAMAERDFMLTREVLLVVKCVSGVELALCW